MVTDHQPMTYYSEYPNTKNVSHKSCGKVLSPEDYNSLVNYAHYYVDASKQYSACDICSNCSNIAMQCNATDSDTVLLFSRFFPSF